MGVLSSGVLANAVINVTGNVSGLRSAMRETQTQLWGMMTLANRFGGVMTNMIASPYHAFRGMQQVAAGQYQARLAYGNALQAWQAQKPVRPTAPPSALALTNPQLYNQLMAQFLAAMARFPGQMATWRQGKPNQQAFVQQFVQSAAVAEGKTLLLTSAMLGLGTALVNAAQYASNFVEELNKMTQTFGMTTDKVMAKVEGLARIGIGRSQFMSGVSSMGIEMLGAGINEKRAASMSYALGRRAVDVSSLYNIDQDTAIRKFQSGLAGFGRPLKELGVIITEARAETYAFTHGLWDGKSKMSEFAKVTARFGLIMQETQRAEGDYVRTNLELSNQYRMLTGNFSNMMEALGNTAPIQGAILGINMLMMAVRDLANVVSWAYGKYKGAVAWAGGMVGAPGGMEENLLRWNASNQNNEAESRAYADEIIQENFMGKGHNASHMGLADFGKKLQEGVFNDTGKQQLDLTRQLVGLSQEQVRYMRQLGFSNIVSPDFVPF